MALVIGTGLLGLVAIACMLWVIIDIFTNNKRMPTAGKVIWTLLAIFFSIITAIAYYFIEKRK